MMRVRGTRARRRAAERFRTPDMVVGGMLERGGTWQINFGKDNYPVQQITEWRSRDRRQNDHDCAIQPARISVIFGFRLPVALWVRWYGVVVGNTAIIHASFHLNTLSFFLIRNLSLTEAPIPFYVTSKCNVLHTGSVVLLTQQDS